MRQFTSSMLGMMSFSHCLRKESLSKVGSAFTISVSTSDISVLEKRPPEDKYYEKQIHKRIHGEQLFIVCHSPEADFKMRRQWDGALPTKSVTRSVTALEALIRALSLSSYFIFISKNPVGNKSWSEGDLPKRRNGFQSWRAGKPAAGLWGLR